MNEYVAAIILGLIQGITEFLPISSTGHLIIADALMRLNDARIGVFEVVIQFGSILAVVILYRQRFIGLLFPQKSRRFSGFYGLYLLFLTSLPAGLAGLFAHDFIQARLFNPSSVALALAAGAVFILAAERRRGPNPTARIVSLDDLTPRDALGIGLFQCLALWPGFSRSTSTIMGAMLLGAGRNAAAEYSFIAAVPIMAAACGMALLSAADTLSVGDIPFFAVGTLAALLSAIVAVKVLVGLVSRISFRPFAWYRLLIAPFILYLFTNA